MLYRADHLKSRTGTFTGRDGGAKQLEHMGNKLFVGNVNHNATENDLQDHFAAAGTVVSVNIMQDRMTGKPRGFAFVEMGSDDDAQSAIKTLNNFELNGRNLTVNEAKPKTTGGGYGGDGGGGRSRSEPRW